MQKTNTINISQIRFKRTIVLQQEERLFQMKEIGY